jgi:hypothetical protein
MTQPGFRQDPAELVDRGLPVLSVSDIDVAAPADLVWDVLTGIDDWPSWDPNTSAAAVAGDIEEGTTFVFKAGPGTIRSVIGTADRPRLISWKGKSLGISAHHVWTLEPIDESTTRVRTAETFSGVMPSLLRGSLRKTLDRTLHNLLEHLKVEAERRHSSRHA